MVGRKSANQPQAKQSWGRGPLNINGYTHINKLTNWTIYFMACFVGTFSGQGTPPIGGLDWWFGLDLWFGGLKRPPTSKPPRGKLTSGFRWCSSSTTCQTATATRSLRMARSVAATCLMAAATTWMQLGIPSDVGQVHKSAGDGLKHRALSSYPHIANRIENHHRQVENSAQPVSQPGSQSVLHKPLTRSVNRAILARLLWNHGPAVALLSVTMAHQDLVARGFFTATPVWSHETDSRTYL